MYAVGVEAWSAFVKELGTVGGCRGRKRCFAGVRHSLHAPPKSFEETSFIFQNIR